MSHGQSLVTLDSWVSHLACSMWLITASKLYYRQTWSYIAADCQPTAPVPYSVAGPVGWIALTNCLKSSELSFDCFKQQFNPFSFFKILTASILCHIKVIVDSHRNVWFDLIDWLITKPWCSMVMNGLVQRTCVNFAIERSVVQLLAILPLCNDTRQVVQFTQRNWEVWEIVESTYYHTGCCRMFGRTHTVFAPSISAVKERLDKLRHTMVGF